MNDAKHRISETADKIVLKTQVKRGQGTRDQDKLDVKVKGSDPAETAARLNEKETTDTISSTSWYQYRSTRYFWKYQVLLFR